MDLIQESFQRLYPGIAFDYTPKLEYNRRLSDFNANISYDKRNKIIKINLNLQWKDIDDEIKIGLIQHLLSKIFKSKKTTTNTNLYNNFTKNIHILTPKTKSDPILEASFNRLNEQFFYNQLDKPNLQWGQDSFRRLASYNFHNDSITLSTLFKDANQEIIDSIMHHELLHKHLKFKNKNGRSSFHSKEFREAERAFPNHEQIEKEIEQIIRKKRVKRKKSGWKVGNWQF